MTPQQWDAFLHVHHGLPRQGPGGADDVHWAIETLGLSGPVDVFEGGCGPGDDLVALAEALPQARITGVEQVADFVTQAAARTAPFGPRVTARIGDMASPEGRYDLIWCTGALYFLGVTPGLTGWRGALKPGGRVVFSEPVLLETPASNAVSAFWEDYPQITDLDGIEAQVTAAGYNTLAHRMIVGAPWAAYYDPMQARIDRLRLSTSDAVITAALDEAQTEIDRWRAAPAQIAYALLVVAPA